MILLFTCSISGNWTEIFSDLKNKFEYQILSFYLSAGYFTRNKSFFQGIQKLEPGSYLKFNKNEFYTKKYWNINDYNPVLKKINSLNYYVDEFDNLLKELFQKILWIYRVNHYQNW